MKRCPECRRDYFDDTLSFCLADGAELVYGVTDDEPSTAILSEPGAVRGPREGIPSGVQDATGLPGGESPTRTQIHTTDRTSIYACDPEAEPQGKIGDSTERRSLSAHRAAKPLVAVIVLILILAAGFFGYQFFSPANSKQIESIAVMPFVNESGDPDAEYLSDGMTETLMASLLELPNLSVKVRSSVFRYKGKGTDTRTIGNQPIKIWPNESAYYFAAAGDKATALSKLEGSRDNMQLLYLNVEPLYDPLRDEPRFLELLKKVGFPN